MILDPVFSDGKPANMASKKVQILYPSSILTVVSVPSTPNRLIFNTSADTDRWFLQTLTSSTLISTKTHNNTWQVHAVGLCAEADVWRSDTKGGSEGHAALHLDCEQTGGKTRDTAAQQGEENSSDAEETDGASQQDISTSTFTRVFLQKYWYLYLGTEYFAISEYLHWPVNTNRQRGFSIQSRNTTVHRAKWTGEKKYFLPLWSSKNIKHLSFICFVLNEKWDSHRGSRLLTSSNGRWLFPNIGLSSENMSSCSGQVI